MELALLFLPLASFVISGFFGKYIGDRLSEIITSLLVSISAILALFIFYEVITEGYTNNIVIASWIQSGSLNVNWSIKVDAVSAVMLVVVTLISSLVHIYSIGYMSHDKHKPRFMAYLSLFTFAMLTLVTSDNFLQLFFGWEGVGLCSYFLIGFWFKKDSANSAAIKAFVVNRVGDFGFALGIFLIFYLFGTVNYNEVFQQIPQNLNNKLTILGLQLNSIDLICLLLFIGAMGKSAQILLHTWLPDAMEGPTPVSALIHAATMVTAGVYLVARCSPIFEFAPKVLIVVTIIGAITAFFAGATGLLQNDIKRVIAYSTCSQLGYIIFACGLSSYQVAIFHLANHASFKALLFLSAGAVIHALGDEQDIRKIGGLVKILPFTYSIFFIGSLALIGFPFLTGFYSKDLIMEVAFGQYTISAHFAHWLGTGAAFFTAFYSIRLLYLTFLTKSNSYKRVIEKAHEPGLKITIPLFFLSLGALFLGYISKDIKVGIGTDFWGNALFTHPQHLGYLEAEFIPAFIKLMPVIFSILGAILAFYMYINGSSALYDCKINNWGSKLYGFLNRKWFFDKIYNELLSQKILSFSYSSTYKLIDRGLFEALGPLGLGKLVWSLGGLFRNLETGYIYHYSLIIILGLSFYLGLLSLWPFVEVFLDSRLVIICLIGSILYLITLFRKVDK